MNLTIPRFAIALLLAGRLCAAEAPPGGGTFVQPIAELVLPNGMTFKNVTVVRYEKERVVLKSSAGIGGLPYTYLTEPLRSQMLAERDTALGLKSAADKDARTAESQKINDASLRVARVEELIRKKSIAVGMTEAEALKAWGSPSSINSTNGTGGRFDQWVYERRGVKTRYVYFTGGSLSSWQD